MEDFLLQHLLANGFAVIAPDFLGLGRFDTGPHPYLGIDTEVAATTDLLRAVRTLRGDLSSRWISVGTSQGGQAALGVGHQHRWRTGDLDYRGTIAMDPESHVEWLLHDAEDDALANAQLFLHAADDRFDVNNIIAAHKLHVRHLTSCP